MNKNQQKAIEEFEASVCKVCHAATMMHNEFVLTNELDKLYAELKRRHLDEAFDSINQIED